MQSWGGRCVKKIIFNIIKNYFEKIKIKKINNREILMKITEKKILYSILIINKLLMSSFLYFLL